MTVKLKDKPKLQEEGLSAPEFDKVMKALLEVPPKPKDKKTAKENPPPSKN